AIGLLEVLSGLNAGVDLGGSAIGAPTAFTAGCAFDPGAEDLPREIARLRRKVEAGARFMMTQPIYGIETLERALDRLGGAPIPLLLGVMPLYSHRHAVYLDREVPGISVP
ncbi:methylenetetrahydrofolate reductase family protein, partial [mine drainage metagenome]